MVIIDYKSTTRNNKQVSKIKPTAKYSPKTKAVSSSFYQKKSHRKKHLGSANPRQATIWNFVKRHI